MSSLSGGHPPGTPAAPSPAPSGAVVPLAQMTAAHAIANSNSFNAARSQPTTAIPQANTSSTSASAQSHAQLHAQSQQDGSDNPSSSSLRQRPNVPPTVAPMSNQQSVKYDRSGLGGNGNGNGNNHSSDTDTISSTLTVPGAGSSPGVACLDRRGSDSQSKGDSKRRMRAGTLVPCLSSPPCVSRVALSITVKAVRKRVTVRAVLCALPVLIVVILALHLRPTLRRTYHRLFGVHPIEGGSLGHWLDGIFVQYAIDAAFHRQTKYLQEKGVVLSDMNPVNRDRTLEIDYHAGLRELLVRRETRTKLILDMNEASRVWAEGCRFNETSSDSTAARTATESFGMIAGIPKVIHVPDVPGWVAPRPRTSKPFRMLTFSDVEMRRFVKDNHRTLLQIFTDMKDPYDKISLWSIVVLYHYGGVVFGNGAEINPALINAFSDVVANTTFKSLVHGCVSPIGFVALEADDLAQTQALRIAMLAMTPYHPLLRCMLDHIEYEKPINMSSVLRSLFVAETWGAEINQSNTHDPSLFPWRITHTKCSLDKAAKQKCCVRNNRSKMGLSAIVHRKRGSRSSQGEIFGHLRQVPRKTNALRSSRIFVTIREEGNPKKPLVGSKVFLEKRLKEQGAEPNWLCSRCLKSPVFGSLEKCSQVCSGTYEKLLCEPNNDSSMTTIDVAVLIKQHSGTDFVGNRIPRIVHQTWFEPITPDLYPQLSRLQNSWRHSGWEYRFYTDTDAREYIMVNYPPHFLEAFDAVIPGAYKADLFRYLVLLKDGGIYADIDIKLDTTLDSFVTPNLSFFAPRDAVAEYAGEPFCLWNGMIGSAPGHPFMLRAVERLVNLVIQRSDLYDLERSVCQSDGRKTENWKVRIEPQLFLSGPCALGIAVNEVLNRTSLTGLAIGWLPDIEGDVDHGDALVLVGDKYDLGSFRISDPERNIMIATTDMPGINKESRTPTFLTPGDKLRLTTRRGDLPHYSTTTIGRYIWGQEAVYKDDVVINKQVRMRAVILEDEPIITV